jgi:hypothetical protein
MATATSEQVMAKRNDITVKVDREIIAECRAVAVLTGVSLSEYLSETLRAAAAVDMERVLAKRAARASQPKPPRR